MNSPILPRANTTTTALHFEASEKKSSFGGDNFGAALDRASSLRSSSHQNMEKLLHRKPAPHRTAKHTAVKRFSNPRRDDGPQSTAARKAESTVRSSAHDSHATDGNFAKRSSDINTRLTEDREDESLAGAMAAHGVAKPVELAGGSKSFGNNGEHGDHDENSSAATAAVATPDTETAPGLRLASNPEAMAAEAEEMQAGQALPGDFEYLKSPESTPELAAASSEAGLPVSDSKMILVPDALKKEIEMESRKDANTNASSDQEAAQPASAALSDAEIVPPTDASLLTPPANDGRPMRAARAAKGLATENVGDLRNNRSQVDGISAAKTAVTMKNTPNKDEFAGSGRQELPGGNISAARALHNSALNGTAKESVTELMFAAATGDTSKIFDSRSDGIAVGDIERFAPARMERIGEIISREVRMFRRAADDQVDVVLTPDARTQISLRLQWRDGQVEVQARCELGDHHALSLQWAQLQTSLAQQGVRLASLTERTSTGFTEFFNPSSFSQSHNGQPRHNDAEAGGGQRQPALTPPVSGLPPATARHAGLSVKAAPTNDRFETWA